MADHAEMTAAPYQQLLTRRSIAADEVLASGHFTDNNASSRANTGAPSVANVSQ